MLLFLAAMVQLDVDILAAKFNVGDLNNSACLNGLSVLLDLLFKL